MLRITMLVTWALGAIYLVKSYITGVANMAGFEGVVNKSMATFTMLGGPTAHMKDASDTALWFHIGALVSFAIYAVFTKQIMKEFGPNAK